MAFPKELEPIWLLQRSQPHKKNDGLMHVSYHLKLINCQAHLGRQADVANELLRRHPNCGVDLSLYKLRADGYPQRGLRMLGCRKEDDRITDLVLYQVGEEAVFSNWGLQEGLYLLQGTKEGIIQIHLWANTALPCEEPCHTYNPIPQVPPEGYVLLRKTNTYRGTGLSYCVLLYGTRAYRRRFFGR